MRAILTMLLVLPALAFAAGGNVIRLSEPVAATATHETFGAPLPDGKPISLSEAVAAMDERDGEAVLIETEVVEVCRKKGCFFIARDGGTTARVKFVDYGFFVPTDTGGKRVTLAGTLERVELSAAQAAHYAEDAGGDPSTAAPGFEIRITASGVRVPKG